MSEDDMAEGAPILIAPMSATHVQLSCGFAQFQVLTYDDQLVVVAETIDGRFLWTNWVEMHEAIERPGCA